MRLVLVSIGALAVLAASCAPGASTGNAAVDLNAAAERGRADIDNYSANRATPTESAPLAPAEPGQPGGLPDDHTPIAETPAAPDSAQAAATVVETYYALIGERKFAAAHALWADDGLASGQSPAAFAADLSDYREYHANVGAPGRVDAGAGQRYVTVPVQVYARRSDGTPAYWRGDVVLHRTADIDGATAEQKSWRIQSIDLMPAPGKAVDASAPAAAARYRCMDGSKLAVRFDDRAGTAAIVRGGVTLATLGGRRSAAGIGYRRAGYELRGSGDAATLTTPGRPPIPCTVIR